VDSHVPHKLGGTLAVFGPPGRARNLRFIPSPRLQYKIHRDEPSRSSLFSGVENKPVQLGLDLQEATAQGKWSKWPCFLCLCFLLSSSVGSVRISAIRVSSASSLLCRLPFRFLLSAFPISAFTLNSHLSTLNLLLYTDCDETDSSRNKPRLAFRIGTVFRRPTNPPGTPGNVLPQRRNGRGPTLLRSSCVRAAYRRTRRLKPPGLTVPVTSAVWDVRRLNRTVGSHEALSAHLKGMLEKRVAITE